MTDKTWLIQHIQSTRAAFDEKLRHLPREAYDQPVAPGGVTHKELLYHIAWHERQMTGMLRARALSGSPWWDLPTDERNANIQAEAAPLSVDGVLAYADSSITELLLALHETPAEALDDASCFAGMPSDWSPADILAQNTYQHYEQH